MTSPNRGIRIEAGGKRIRTYLGGELIAETVKPLMVWEKPYYPVYYFPIEDVRMDLLTESGTSAKSPSRGIATIYNLKAGVTEASEAAYAYLDPKIERLAGHVAFKWSALDAWFEEDEEVYVHARDPYTRIDALPSSRHVEVFVADTKIADTTNAVFLFETGLPTRYYIPKTDVRMDMLTPTELHTSCPYKGVASYYSVDVEGESHENVVWWYPFPAEESGRVRGLVSFYNEKVDIVVDGTPEDRPKTVFS